MSGLENIIDSSRVKGAWKDVNNGRISYLKALNNGKPFKSIYNADNERMAYAETLKADYSISNNGNERSAWKHLQAALDACPNFHDAIALATIIHLDRDRFPKLTKFNKIKTDIASSVKKNINKLKAQAQAMISKEETDTEEADNAEEGEEGYEDDNSDEEVEDAGEQIVYSVEKRGWQIIVTEEFSANPHLLECSPYVLTSYQIVQMCVALALGYDRIRQNSVEDELKGDKLLQDLWDILTQYSKIVLKEASPFAVLQRVPSFDTTIVYNVITHLPQYYLTHSSISIVVETYRILLSTAGKYPHTPFPTTQYLNMLERFASLLFHVLHDSSCYPPIVNASSDLQVPETALEEAILLLLLLKKQMNEIESVEKILEISKLAYQVYCEAGLWNEGVKYMESILQFLGHSALIWYFIAHLYNREHNYVLCLQSLQNCLRDIQEYGQDKENTAEVTSSMALLFSARVCLVQLNRIDDCRHFAALVLSEETRPQALSQALHLSGLCALLEARHTSFFSDRQAILKNAVEYLLKAKSYAVVPNQFIEYNIALAYAEQGLDGEAIRGLQDLLRRNPFFEPAWHLLIILSYNPSEYHVVKGLVQQAREVIGDSLSLKLLECKMIYCHDGKMALPLIDSLFQRVRSLVGEENKSLADSVTSDDYEGIDDEMNTSATTSTSLTEDCLLFCARVYADQGLVDQSEKVLLFLATGENQTLTLKVRCWNERIRLLLLQNHFEEAEVLLHQAKLYNVQLTDTLIVEAGVLITSAQAMLEEVSQLREEGKTTLDSLLVREHECTKRLLAADHVLRSVIQKDQRIAGVWAMWGEVLELLGDSEKAAEAMLTGLEWDKVNSFESVSVCNIVISLVC